MGIIFIAAPQFENSNEVAAMEVPPNPSKKAKEARATATQEEFVISTALDPIPITELKSAVNPRDSAAFGSVAPGSTKLLQKVLICSSALKITCGLL